MVGRADKVDRGMDWWAVEVGGRAMVGVGVIMLGATAVEMTAGKEEGSRTDEDLGGSAVFIGLMPAIMPPMPSKVEDVDKIECFDIEAN